jgi:hypothetical protein
MASNKFQFVKPENWRVIKPEKYKDFSILSTELVPCVYGFAIEKEQGFDVVSMFDYGESSGEFIRELNNELIRLETNNKDVDSINDYIKENASDYIVTETTSMKPIFHKTAKIFGKNCFVNIMEIKTNIGKNYSLQIFVKLDRNLVCFGTSVSKVDTVSPFESIVTKNKYVEDLLNVVIKSLEETKK